MQEMLDLRKRRNEPGPSRGVQLGPGPSDLGHAYAESQRVVDSPACPSGGYTVEWQLDGSGDSPSSS